jgi:hypothetical protein
MVVCTCSHGKAVTTTTTEPVCRHCYCKQSATTHGGLACCKCGSFQPITSETTTWSGGSVSS